MRAHPPSRGIRLLRGAATLAADLLFPRRCGVCGTFGDFLCAPCVAALPTLTGPRCPTCAGSRPRGDVCPICASLGGQTLDSLTVAFAFDGGARRLVHRLKYERLSALAAPMGALMAVVPGLDERIAGGPSLGSRSVDLIIPTPLHPRRRRDRGFNQSALLARAVGARHGVAVDVTTLARVRHTMPQVRTSSAAERGANVAGAFACHGPLEGLTVMLVDDVATTGATLRACAAALRAAGVRAVHGLVFAHEDAGRVSADSPVSIEPSIDAGAGAITT